MAVTGEDDRIVQALLDLADGYLLHGDFGGPDRRPDCVNVPRKLWVASTTRLGGTSPSSIQFERSALRHGERANGKA